MKDQSSTNNAGTGRGGRVIKVLLLLLGPIVIAGASAWIYLHGGRYINTDNAYIKTEILAISANVSGMVMEVLPRESEIVEKGQLLLRVDDQPFRIAVARAEANLANVRGDIASMKAELINKQLEIDKAHTDLDYRNKELERVRGLIERNSISEVQFDQAQYARDSAVRDLDEKVQALQVVMARLIDPDQPIDSHPRVKQALAELEKARLDLSYTNVIAPANGVVVNISTHAGENVVSGAPLMSLVDGSRVWLEANFKETDLTYLQLGQSATISVDTYPDLELEGHVVVITPATGAEFSLLPAQNSSGNWIKVVQRIPVIVQFDNYTGTPLLASGMSAEISIDTHHERHLPSWAGLR
jgi:membrane fusion protein (multidrug efflux system)